MEEEYKGTITSKEDFDPNIAAKQFKKAMKGVGTDEKAIIRLLVQHDNLQREEIKQTYMAMYGRDLIDDLKDELGGHFELTVLSMLQSPYSLLLESIRDAFKGAGTDEKALVDILCCRTAEELSSISYHYEEAYGRALKDDLKEELDGDFRDLMRGLIAGGREEDEPKDPVTARKDAQDLYDAGVGKNNDQDASEFIRILNMKSYPQLQEIFKAYEEISQDTLENAIEAEFSGDLKMGLLAIVERVKDPLGFYATRLNKAFAGAGTDDKSVIRILVSRSEIDLADIRSRYKELFDKELIDDLKDETSGDYGKLLQAIVEGK